MGTLKNGRYDLNDLRALSPAMIAYERGRISFGKLLEHLNRVLVDGQHDCDPSELGGSQADRILWVVRKRGGATSAQISRELNIPVDTISQTLHRLRARKQVVISSKKKPFVWSVA